MTEDQIKHMVNRFLGWSLPESFSPDGGVSFKQFGNEGTPHQFTNRPSGTNLLDAGQAEAMVRHMIEGMPVGDEEIRQKVEEWLEKDGKQQLIQAFEKSKMNSKILRTEAQVDPKIMNEPVTI